MELTNTTSIPGVRKHPGGRPKGALNYATREIRDFWHEFFSSPEYREKAKARIQSGSAPQLENYLLALIYGKPRETVELTINTQEDLSALSTEELHERAAQLLDKLKEVKALKEAIDAVVVENGSPDVSIASK